MQYIGTKMIKATPATKGDVWAMKSGFTGDLSAHPEARKQIEAMSDPGYMVAYEDGYVSWSPKEAFDKAYRPTDCMNFGLALEAAKMGKRIARHGWNGKKQYVELATAISYKNAKGEVVNVEHDAIGNKALAFCGTSGVQMGWLASQSDMLADDWYIVEV